MLEMPEVARERTDSRSIGGIIRKMESKRKYIR